MHGHASSVIQQGADRHSPRTHDSPHSVFLYKTPPLVHSTRHVTYSRPVRGKHVTIRIMPESRPAPIIWSAYEHEHIERGSDWFWALGIIAVCIAVTSILLGNVLFAILIIVAAVVILLLARKKPQLHEFEISDKGVRISEEMHSYDEIISFWVDTESGSQPTLLIDTTKFLSPNLIIPLGTSDPEEIRSALRDHAEELPMKEPLAHKILEFFGY